MTENEKIDAIFASVFKLPPKMSHLLRLFMYMPVVNIKLIEEKLGVGYDARILVHRLRKRLYRPHNIIIQNQYGGHYWLTKESKRKVREVVREQHHEQ